MSFLNSFVCPRCKTVFPLWWIPPSRWVRQGGFWQTYFLGVDLQCGNCGQTCRMKVSWQSAAWAWPVATAYIVLMIYFVRINPWFRSLHHNHPGWYGGLAALLTCWPIGIGMRRGLKLITIEEAVKRERPGHKIWMWAVVFCFLAVLIGYGFLTGHWSIVIVDIIVISIMWSCFYYFIMKKQANKGKQEFSSSSGEVD